MDPRGLVAFVVTFHEAAALLALLVAVTIGLVGSLVLRSMPPTRRLLVVLAFALGGSLLTFGAVSRLFHVTSLDVEVVRLGSSRSSDSE